MDRGKRGHNWKETAREMGRTHKTWVKPLTPGRGVQHCWCHWDIKHTKDPGNCGENGCVQTWILPYVTAQGQLKGWGQSQDAPKCLVASPGPPAIPPALLIQSLWSLYSMQWDCLPPTRLPGYPQRVQHSWPHPSWVFFFFFFSCLVLSREDECLGICNVLFQRRAVWCQSRTKNQEIRDQRP